MDEWRYVAVGMAESTTDRRRRRDLSETIVYIILMFKLHHCNSFDVSKKKRPYVPFINPPVPDGKRTSTEAENAG